MKTRRVRLRTSRQLRAADANGDRKRRAETLTGTVVKTFGRSSEALVRFDGPQRLGSASGCTLIVDLDHTEPA